MIALPNWENIRQGSRRENTSCRKKKYFKMKISLLRNTTKSMDRSTQPSLVLHIILFRLDPTCYLLEETNLTPLRSLRPLGCRILMYLEAMRNPMKQTVKTLAMGNTAYLSMDSTDVSVEPPCAAVASASRSDLSTMA